MTEMVPHRPRATKGRSPSYPGISLGKAVDRAEQMYDVVQRARVPIQTIVGTWGYSGLSGRANATLAALKKFGLLDETGSGDGREAQLTDLALRIVIDRDREAIREAALTPPVHAEIFELFGEKLPPGSVMRPELVRKRNFTEAGYSEFISEYEETMAFAELRRGDSDDDLEDDWSSDDNSDAVRTVGVPTRTATTPMAPSVASNVLLIPLFGDKPPVRVEFPGKIPEADWDQFMAVLNVMKPTILSAPPGPQPDALPDPTAN